MEIIANLQKTLEALDAKLDTNGSDTSVTTNSYRKHAKTGQSPCKNNMRQDSSSDSESDHEMDKQPDMQETADPLITQTEEAHISMEDDATELNGGIQDDNISETMLQANEDQTAHSLSSDSISHMDNQGDNDL